MKGKGSAPIFKGVDVTTFGTTWVEVLHCKCGKQYVLDSGHKPPAPEPKCVKCSFNEVIMEAVTIGTAGIKLESVPPWPHACTCGYVLKPEDKRCPLCKIRHSPDPPLRAQVAKALYPKSRITQCFGEGKKWYFYRDGAYKDILPYDTDDTQADIAAVEYLKIANKNRKVAHALYRFQIDMYSDGSGGICLKNDIITIKVNFGGTGEIERANNILWAKTKSEAICQAIVKHKEATEAS